jgi:transposase InsO family protein
MLPANETFHSSIAAALLLLGRELMNWTDWPTTDQILKQTGASRSQAYAMASRLKERLPTLMGKPGRPTSEPASMDSLLAVSRCIQNYLIRHPGSAYFDQGRHHYLDDFRRFIVGLVEPGQPGEGLSVAQLAEASSIPLGTLKSWFGSTPISEPKDPPSHSLRQEHHHQIITLYQNWKGPFKAFCRVVREEHRLNYGDTAIGALLHQAGLRRRKSATRDTPNRGSYRKLFPGAQWLGDGSTMRVHLIPVQCGKDTFVFNLEAILDVSSDALVGLSISDVEDEAAVLSAFQDAIATAKEPPLSLSLDNKPCNHTSAIDQATREVNTTLLTTTPHRPQSKAPLEGAFGHFKQCLPEIVISADDPRALARSVLALVFWAWARGRNGRPRRRLDDMSPADYYFAAHPTPEEIAEARRYIGEQRRKQEAMRRTREERADPIKLEFLKQALSDLNIADPKHRLAIDLAYYSRDSIVDGVGIFQAKRRLGTIPDGADPGRYLRGIIQKAYDQAELSLSAEFHIKNRLLMRDLSLHGLTIQAQEVQRRFQEPGQQLRAFIDRALAAPYTVDYHFWVLRCHEALSAVPIEMRTNLYQGAARRIAASYRADRSRKQSLLARLARTLSE